jgi:hypothetical protein
MPDDRVANLYGLPAEEFTNARDALVKALKAEGDKEGAAEVKALRRPTVAAWAVNQVARDRPELVDAVVEAGERLAAAQAGLRKGSGRDELKAAMANRREAVNAATKAAVALAGAGQRDAIHATFDAAATDEEAAAEVREGRLAKELDPPSSFALFGGGPATEVDEDEPEPEPDEPEVDEAAIAEAEQRLAEARAEVEAATDAKADLQRRLREADERLDAAEQAVAEAKAALKELHDR